MCQYYSVGGGKPDGVLCIPELHVKGDPIGPVLAFRTNTSYNIYAIGDKMSKRGCNVSAFQNPSALHVSVTLPWVNSADRFVLDFKQCVEELVKDPSSGEGATAAIYGTAATTPDKTNLTMLLLALLIFCTKLDATLILELTLSPYFSFYHYCLFRNKKTPLYLLTAI
ncbi:hypothetical protein BY458DRAFT_561238 [Sporodiniella umbellata]|nr:hypothetical protein BY458DRAFT_561238 [Sporodiniella umbellata]